MRNYNLKLSFTALTRRHIILALIASLLVAGSLFWNLHNETKNTYETAAAAARANIRKDLIFRKWATFHGGVYIPPTKNTPPNPYLKIPDRDVTTTSGKKLTLMNPAYLLRDVQNNFVDDFGTKSHITSLKLLNPENAPDAWEHDVLQAFEKGEKERLEIRQINGKPYLRMMQPLITETGCLKCHGFQGYKEGDIRGGISTSIPLDSFLANESRMNSGLMLSHLMIWLLGMTGLGISYWRENRQLIKALESDHELHKLGKQNQLILDSAGEGIYGLDNNGVCTFVNSAAMQMLGFNADEIIGRHSHDLFNHSTEDGNTEPVENCPVFQTYTQGAVNRGPDFYWRKDGNGFPVEFTSTPIIEDNITTGAVVVFRDVTEQLSTNRKLRESEIKFRAMTDISPLAIYMSSGIEQKAEYINSTFTKLFGYTIEDIPSAAEWWPLAYPDADYRRQVSEEWQEKVAEAIRNHSDIEPMEVVVTCKDGTKKNIQWGYISTGTQNWAFGLDLTARKQAEENLRLSEQGLAEAQRMTHLGNWNLDIINNILTWSDEIYRIFEMEKGKSVVSYETFLNAIHPDDREMVNNAYTESLKSKKPYDIIHRLLMKDGRIKYVTEKCETYYSEDGVPLRSVGTVHDITDRMKVEEELREKEERLALATLHNGVGIWDWNLQTREMIWDDSMYALYHIKREDFSGTEEAWRTALHPDDLERGDREIADAISGNKPFDTDFRVVWPNGEIHFIKAVAKVFRNDQGTPMRMLGTNLDITELKVAEEKIRVLNRDLERLVEKRTEQLRESEERFRSIAANTPDHLMVQDSDLRYTLVVNPQLGLREDDILGKTDYDFLSREEAEMLTKVKRQVLDTGTTVRLETSLKSNSGEDVFFDGSYVPKFNANGETDGVIGYFRNVTEQKLFEERISRLNQALLQKADALESANSELEAFSYSVSHDLRTPLRAIDGFSRILLDDYFDKLDDEGKRLLNVVRDNTGRMGQLIDDILKFSRAGRLEIMRSEIDMEKMAHEVYEEINPADSKHVVKIEIDHIPSASGDRSMMRQIFVNLLSNAVKFSRFKEPAIIRVGSYTEGNDTVYYVSDNGAGFNMEYVDKLFGVFQRLHGMNDFEGTGIGLAIVKRIVTRHGGKVWAEGKVGEGATIYFTLPVKESHNE